MRWRTLLMIVDAIGRLKLTTFSKIKKWSMLPPFPLLCQKRLIMINMSCLAMNAV